jgi:hypothetical protein
MVMVDANVVLDLLTNDPKWVDWSARQMASARDEGLLVINPIIYAEVANAFSHESELNSYFAPTDFVREALPWNAAWHAARAFASYRKAGGAKASPLPDFYIGAHAVMAGHTLIAP